MMIHAGNRPQALRNGAAGRGPAPGRRPPLTARFTLVELLVVIVIMGILMALVVPAFKNFGGGVDGAARMVGSQLRLARQYAIAHRQKVAVIMPGPAAGAPADKRYVGFRTARWNAVTNVFQGIPGTKWEFLPKGTVIAEADNDKNPDQNDNPWTPKDDTYTAVDYDEDGDGSRDYGGGLRAVVFLPSGRLDSDQRYVTITQGFFTGTQLQITNRENYAILEIDQYTGRVSYVPHK